MARMLLVDDDPMILLAFKTLLENSELEIETVDNLDAAKDLLEKTTYDAVVTDLRLGGVLGQEGLEVIATLRKTNPNTKVILMTAYGNPEVKDEALKLGADLYLEKPVSTAELREALKSLGVLK